MIWKLYRQINRILNFSYLFLKNGLLRCSSLMTRYHCTRRAKCRGELPSYHNFKTNLLKIFRTLKRGDVSTQRMAEGLYHVLACDWDFFDFLQYSPFHNLHNFLFASLDHIYIFFFFSFFFFLFFFFFQYILIIFFFFFNTPLTDLPFPITD